MLCLFHFSIQADTLIKHTIIHKPNQDPFSVIGLHKYNQSRTVSEYIYLSTILRELYFTQVHLRGKYCTLYSTTFLSITVSKK